MSVSEDKPKKVLIFSIAYIPFVGGAEIAVKEITDRIKDAEFDMITLRFDKKWPKFEKIGNVNVYRISTSKLFFPSIAFLKGLTLRLKNKYQIIWAIMANRAGFAALFFKIFNPKVKFLLTLQEGDALDYPKKQMGIFWMLLKPLFRAIFSRTDYIQAISKYLGNWAREMRTKNPIEIVPNGVEIEKFLISNSQFLKEDFKKQLGFREDEKILITTSRLVEKNAIGDVIEALKYLPDNIKFLILGTGPLEEELKLKAKSYKLQARTMFLGHIEPEKMPQYLAISDVFARPSLSEGLGSSFLEAMAAGVPVVATPVGGILDFLKDGETGLFCEVNNPKSIAEKVKILLENKELREKIIKNARELVIKNYDWNLIAEKMRNIFNKLS
ncbi:MAG: glycosyltransferase family 4 protein [Candidatus Tagabacteria bacterium]